MLSWLIAGTYVLGIVLATRLYARIILNSEHDQFGEVDDEDRWMALIVGACLGFCWPLVVPVHALMKLSNPKRWLRSDREVQAAQRAELNRLRDLAKRYNLPMGDE